MNKEIKNKVKNLEILSLIIENKEKAKMKELNYLIPFLVKEVRDNEF